MIAPPHAVPPTPSPSAGAETGSAAPFATQLRELPLFADLPDDVVDEVAAQARRRTVPAGEVLCRVGEPGDAFYVVDAGMVRVLVPSPRGEELVAQLGPGQWFGEMALITGELRSATVVAAVETTLVVLERRAFQDLLHRAPHAAMVISDTLSRRLRAHLLAGPPAVRPRRVVAVAPPTADARRVLLNLAVALHDEMQIPVTLLDAPPEGTVPDGVTVRSQLSERELETMPLVIARVDPDRQTAESPVPRPDALWVFGGVDAGPPVAHPGVTPTLIDWSAERAWVHTQRAVRFDRSILDDPAVVRTAPRSGAAFALRRFARIIARRRVGIAFSAGGARGIAHVGALRCFERAGIEFDMIAGTSMGGIIGGGVAYGMTSADLYSLLREIALNPRRTLLDFGLPHAAILRGRKKSEIFRRQGPTVRFEDLPTPFWAVAADLVTGREFVLSSGIVWQAVDATTAIPGLFPPVRIGDHRFVDGWIVNSLPADVLRREGADTVLAVCVSAGRQGGAEEAPPMPSVPEITGWRGWLRRATSPTIGRNFLTAIDIGARERTLANLALVDVCVTPDLKGYTVSDFRRLDELVDRGEAAAEITLPAIRAALAGQRA